jgi:hypothetical protein
MVSLKVIANVLFSGAVALIGGGFLVAIISYPGSRLQDAADRVSNAEASYWQAKETQLADQETCRPEPLRCFVFQTRDGGHEAQCEYRTDFQLKATLEGVPG